MSTHTKEVLRFDIQPHCQQKVNPAHNIKKLEHLQQHIQMF